MQKTRRLMDESSVSFQMFLILLSFITLGSESQMSVFKQCQSNTHMSTFEFWRGPGSMRRSQNFARFNFSRLSFYFKILSYVACSKKITRLASKNSVKFGEKSTRDF